MHDARNCLVITESQRCAWYTCLQERCKHAYHGVGIHHDHGALGQRERSLCEGTSKLMPKAIGKEAKACNSRA
jgi:hypothetical protein